MAFRSCRSCLGFGICKVAVNCEARFFAGCAAADSAAPETGAAGCAAAAPEDAACPSSKRSTTSTFFSSVAGAGAVVEVEDFSVELYRFLLGRLKGFVELHQTILELVFCRAACRSSLH